MSVEIGPALILRVASVPVGVLSSFSETSLAEMASHAAGEQVSSPDYEKRYEAAIETGRRELWDRTAGDPRFALALSFAHPRLGLRLVKQGRDGRRSPKRRRLETTLYRYLARAAGRCQPFGLWAGVSLVSWGETTRVKPCAPALKVEPDLGPLYEVVASLARSPSYRSSGRWRVNPSLGRARNGEWTLWSRAARGAAPNIVPPLTGFDALVARLADCRASNLDSLAEAIRPLCGSAEAAGSLLDDCVTGGILIGGLQPPWRFQTAWEALEIVEADLLMADRLPWRKARTEIEAACRDLEGKGTALSASEILMGNERVAAVVRRLAAEVGVPVPEKREAVLRADLRAPYSIELGGEIRALVDRTLDEYLRFQGAYGMGEFLREAVLDHYVPQGASARSLGALPPPLVGSPEAPTWQALGAAIGATSGWMDRVARWERLLADSRELVVARGEDEPLGPPFGWLRLGFTSPPGRDGKVAVHGVFDDLWGPYARHAPFWSDAGLTDGLQGWLVSRLSTLASASGIELAELVAPCATAPNVLARPALGLRAVSPWSDTPGAADLSGGRVVLDVVGGAPFLRLPGTDSPIAVLNSSAADVQSGDPLVQALLTTSLGATPATSLHAGSLLFAHELTGDHFSPTVVLPGGAIVRTGRWVLSGESAQELVCGGPAARFAAWSGLARRHGWPELLVLRRPDGLALPLHRDSPLAVEALLEGAPGSPLVVEDWPAEAWIEGPEGTHVAELAVPFLRGHHIWSGPARRGGTR